MVTAYDYPSALIADKAGIDVILVGDSLGMVVLGYENTLPVTLEEVIHHAKAVTRAAKRPLIVGDMPFMTFNVNQEEAVRNAGLLFKEAGVDAVKIEGGAELKDTVSRLVGSGIAVMGHIGLTPQRISLIGGYRVQGRDAEGASRLIGDAKALEEAGVFALVLECVTSQVAELITRELSIPTIGIGAGPHCDGQVLVLHDMLGMFDRLKLRFVKRYADLNTTIEGALKSYVTEVREGDFPSEDHSFSMEEMELKKLVAMRGLESR